MEKLFIIKSPITKDNTQLVEEYTNDLFLKSEKGVLDLSNNTITTNTATYKVKAKRSFDNMIIATKNK